MVVRREGHGDRDAVRRVVLAAFGQTTEADLADRLRKARPLAVSLVALERGEIVGHLLFTPAVITAPRGGMGGMGLAPLSVLPGHQGRGVGTALVEEGLSIRTGAGCPFVIVLGYPDYYRRFGFRTAAPRGIVCPWGAVPREAFMVLALDPVAMEGVTGEARYRDEFDTLV